MQTRHVLHLICTITDNHVIIYFVGAQCIFYTAVNLIFVYLIKLRSASKVKSADSTITIIIIAIVNFESNMSFFVLLRY